MLLVGALRMFQSKSAAVAGSEKAEPTDMTASIIRLSIAFAFVVLSAPPIYAFGKRALRCQDCHRILS